MPLQDEMRNPPVAQVLTDRHAGLARPHDEDFHLLARHPPSPFTCCAKIVARVRGSVQQMLLLHYICFADAAGPADG
ncbi:hypothetical protein Ade02nite_16590 [Paractinoplanes deccanensis]|uniref:Uncharacterized protein n=1 Tax=Paractinoplanes deccanensis TaxID=113561 RepID=A0ABQ3XZ37_9ACTN|nr:hypothetical protein Ade02nite_16590 [Actinoplanes deccanensis]